MVPTISVVHKLGVATVKVLSALAEFVCLIIVLTVVIYLVAQGTEPWNIL